MPDKIFLTWLTTAEGVNPKAAACTWSTFRTASGDPLLKLLVAEAIPSVDATKLRICSADSFRMS